jgi:hypothetical protein
VDSWFMVDCSSKVGRPWAESTGVRPNIVIIDNLPLKLRDRFVRL